MEINIRDGEEFIRLGQALKKSGLVSSGVDLGGRRIIKKKTVNGEIEVRRGRKLYSKDTISFENQTIKIIK